MKKHCADINVLYYAGVWSQRPPESGFWPGVGVSHLKETLTPVPICLLWTFV